MTLTIEVLVIFAIFAVAVVIAEDTRRRRKRKPRCLVFNRQDGVEVKVKVCACQTCTNYFYAAHVEIETPHFCPYCGVRFNSVSEMSDEESLNIQVY